jgi:transmembrane sensor
MAVSFAAAPDTAPATISLKDPGRDANAAASPREFKAVSVAELVAEANRTSSRPIRLEDPAIGEHAVSGRFRIDDSEVLADRLAALLNLSVDREEPRELVIRAK